MRRSPAGRYAAVLLGIAAGVTVLAACGVAAGTMTSASPTSPPTGGTAAATTTTDPNAADRALAAGIGLTLADLPTGWRIASAASAAVLNKTACGLAASDSVVLNSSIYRSAATGQRARSETGVATTATVADDRALLEGPQGESCISRFIEQFNAGSVSVGGLSRRPAIATTSGGAIPMTAFRMLVTPKSATTSAPVGNDVIAIFQGRFEGILLFTGMTGAGGAALETIASRAVSARMSAANAR